MGLLLYEITFGTPPPIIPNLHTDLLVELDGQDLYDAICYMCLMDTQGSFGPSSGPSLNLVLPLYPTGYDWGVGSVLGDTAWGNWNPFGRDHSHPAHHTHARPVIPSHSRRATKVKDGRGQGTQTTPSNSGCGTSGGMAPIGDCTHRHPSCRRCTCPMEPNG